MVTGFETPGQRPPTLKNAAHLVSGHEYGLIWTGQSNSRPWGYPVDGYVHASELNLFATGLDLATVVIPVNPLRSVGMIEALVVDSTVEDNQWNTSTWLRLGTNTAPKKGYAKVVASFNSLLHVRWIVLPDDGVTVAGYLVRENGKFSNYEHVRVLTPYMPRKDIRPTVSGVAGTNWVAPSDAAYPVPNAAVSAGGQRLTLPAPYDLTLTAVTDFSDLALFLPATRREGSDGYGISEIADATFPGTGTPTGHPITQIAGQVFTFVNAIVEVNSIAGGYLIVDWESGGTAKRSWAKIASNTTLTFTTDAASWLGDGVPSTPATSASNASSNLVTNVIGWVGHTLSDNDRVFIDPGGIVPGGLVAGRVYYVRNAIAGVSFQLAASPDHPIIDLTTTEITGVNVIQAWVYTAWVHHWKDNPYVWLPGPEFAYANEDQQPQGTFVHFRARGQVFYVHTNSSTPFDGVIDARFGALIPFAWRVGSAIGKRVNVIALGINSSPMVVGNFPNLAVTPSVGWWSYEQYGFALPLEEQGSLAARLNRLITFIAANALLAEGNQKTMRVLAAAHLQGEADALFDAGHELYAALITDYKDYIRGLVDTAGMNPYENGAKVPFVQPLITSYPWEAEVNTVTIVSSGSGSISAEAPATDTNGEVNNAIREANTSDEFANYVHTDDLPKLLYHSLGSVDESHFSGEGFAVIGGRLAAQALDLMEHALGYGSAALSIPLNARLLRIANAALMYLGHGATQITSFSEDSAEARAVATLWPETRDELLSMGQWSWAMRREPATQVLHDDPTWNYCYVVPDRAVTPIAITPPTDLDESAAGTAVATFVSILTPTDPTEFVVRGEPDEFEIKRSPSGHRLLFTNVPQISGDISTPFVTGSLHPERLPRQPWLHYVDKVVDPDRYTNSFASAMAWLLASKLASSLVRGDEGEVLADRFMRKARSYLGAEAKHESVSVQRTQQHTAPWHRNRGL